MSTFFNLNPRLSDFSKEQLMKLLRLVMSEQVQIRKHVNALKETPSLERMFADEIQQAAIDLDEFNEIITHLSSAIYNKDYETKEISN